MWLRMLERIIRLHYFSGLGIHVIMTLSRTRQTICVVKSRIEPLRRVRRRHLTGQHAAHFVVKRFGILRRLEISVGLSPMGPATSHPFEDLTGIAFTPQNRFPVGSHKWTAVLVLLRYSCLPEVFLGQDIDSELRPLFGHLNMV